MANLDLLAALRARAIARGMTLADVARASGMTPGNLRRLLSEGAATPRLGTVMRLLPPLDAAIGPMGARTPAELVGYLDAERGRRGWSWDVMAGGEALGSAMLRRVVEAPETLPLAVVKRFAAALSIEMVIVDAVAASAARVRGERAARKRSVGDAERGGARRRGGASAGGGGDAGGMAACVGEERVRGSAAGASSRSVAGASSTPAASRALRPPRLGRYRDAAPGTSERGVSEEDGREERRGAGAAEVRASDEEVVEREILGGRTRSRMAALRARAHDVSSSLAGISEDVWQGLYALYFVARRGDVPTHERAEEFARSVQELVAQVQRRTAPTEPPFAPGRARVDFDPAVVWELWSRSTASERMPPRPIEWVTVVHGALDGHHLFTVRSPGGRDFVARFVAVGRATEVDFDKYHFFEPSIPFRVRLAGRALAFAHVNVGPICGVIDLSVPGREAHTLLLVAVGWSIAIVEGRGGESRVVWHGAAEELRELDLGERWQAREAGVWSRSGEAAVSEEVAALHEARARESALHQAERAEWARERSLLEERIQARTEDPAVIVEMKAAMDRLSEAFRERLAQVNDGFAQAQALERERAQVLAELGAAQETIASLRATCEGAGEVAELRDAVECLRGERDAAMVERDAALAERDARWGEFLLVREALAGLMEEAAALRAALAVEGERLVATQGERKALAEALEDEEAAGNAIAMQLGEARELLAAAVKEKAEAEAALGSCRQEVVELRALLERTEALGQETMALSARVEELKQAALEGRDVPARRDAPDGGPSQARRLSSKLHKKKWR